MTVGGATGMAVAAPNDHSDLTEALVLILRRPMVAVFDVILLLDIADVREVKDDPDVIAHCAILNSL